MDTSKAKGKMKEIMKEMRLEAASSQEQTIEETDASKETESAEAEGRVEGETVEFVPVPPDEALDGALSIEDQPAAQESVLREAYEHVVRERDELKDQYLRLQAEFINYRKRLARERSEDRERLTQDLIMRLLDVVDNMEHALSAPTNEENVETYRTGVRMIQQQLMGVLGEYGVSRISAAKGAPFDPNFHEAISQVETDEVSNGAIVMEFSPGYQIRDRILRASRVQVATAPKENNSQDINDNQSVFECDN